jgi:hypothetical protein
MSTDLMPDRLREAIGGDLTPVRPLYPLWRRILIVAAVSAAVMAVVLLVLGSRLRPDLAELPMWVGWGASILELVVAIIIVGLALRQSVPGVAVPPVLARAAIAVGLVLQLLVGVATWVHSPGMPAGTAWLAKGVGCLSHDSAMILPTFVVTMWLVFRALPMRAPMAGMIGGFGAALTGDAVTHLLCPMSNLRHVLVWHTGAVIGFALLGWLVGTLWARRRWR